MIPTIQHFQQYVFSKGVGGVEHYPYILGDLFFKRLNQKERKKTSSALVLKKCIIGQIEFCSPREMIGWMNSLKDEKVLIHGSMNNMINVGLFEDLKRILMVVLNCDVPGI